jgi:hypothetical protein
MTNTTDGLTNGGVTSHYKFQYDSTLKKTAANPGGVEPKRTNGLIASAEKDYKLMKGWFGGNLELSNIAVTVTTQSSGASSGGDATSSSVTLKPAGAGYDTSSDYLRYLVVAEVVELFMEIQDTGWYDEGVNEGKKGEALSRFLAAEFLIANKIGGANFFENSFPVANDWLNSSRDDFITNNADPSDNNPDKVTGCTTLFLYFLHTQLGFSIDEIVANGASKLGQVYAKLTGDSADNSFKLFKDLLDTAFPAKQTFNPPKGANYDNPFPLGMLSFKVNLDHFEYHDILDGFSNTGGGQLSGEHIESLAFDVVLEGFNIDAFKSHNVGTPALSGPFKDISGLKINEDDEGIQYAKSSDKKIPQKITFPFDLTFTPPCLSSFPAAGKAPNKEKLQATIKHGDIVIPGAAASTVFELTSNAEAAVPPDGGTPASHGPVTSAKAP